MRHVSKLIVRLKTKKKCKERKIQKFTILAKNVLLSQFLNNYQIIGVYFKNIE